MTQWEIWDQLMAEDEERRIRIARFEAAAVKRQIAKQASEKPSANHPSVVQPPLRPGEGSISRTVKSGLFSAGAFAPAHL